MKYRSEIDGLRAIAVIPVVLFHAGIPGFSSGFIGVDIFFVISGFLITSIIAKDLDDKKFNLINFYDRRIRRILPALLVMILLCVPFAWMWMLPDDLENMGQSIVATLLFANNILLTLTTGYWDLAGEFKPLLHTWSLGVEEQFYLIFPIILMGLWFSRKKIIAILMAILLISLMIFIIPNFFNLTAKENAAIFYNLPTRAWELIIGSIAAILVHKNLIDTNNIKNSKYSFLGFIFIVIALFVPMTEEIHITLRTMIGTVGAGLLVTYASKDNYIGKLLSLKIFVSIGVISYSVYLYHQPLLSFTRIYSKDEPGIMMMIPIFLTFVFGLISFKYIEQPFRNSRKIPKKLLIGWIIAISGILLIFGIYSHKSGGFPLRINKNSESMYKSAQDSIAFNQSAYQYQTEYFSNDEGKKILILGNSFGRDMVNVIKEIWGNKKINIVYSNDYYDCFQNNNSIKHQKLLKSADLIVMASSVLPNENCIKEDIAFIEKNNSKIIYIGTKDFGYNLNWYMRVANGERGTLKNKIPEKIIDHENKMKDIVPEKNYISILKFIEVNGRVPFTNDNGEILSPDRTHLTKSGALFVASKLKESMNAIE